LKSQCAVLYAGEIKKAGVKFVNIALTAAL